MEIKIRPMTRSDIESVMEIECKCFAVPWSKASFEDELTHNSRAIYLVADCGERVVGYAGMWRVLDEAHITNIAVHPEFQRRKIGCALVEGLIDKAKGEHIRHMTLEVRESNHAAQNLYRKYGFKAAGKRKNYYSDNQEDAIIMWNTIIGE